MSIRLNFCRSVPPEFLRSFLLTESSKCQNVYKSSFASQLYFDVCSRGVINYICTRLTCNDLKNFNVQKNFSYCMKEDWSLWYSPSFQLVLCPEITSNSNLQGTFLFSKNSKEIFKKYIIFSYASSSTLYPCQWVRKRVGRVSN